MKTRIRTFIPECFPLCCHIMQICHSIQMTSIPVFLFVASNTSYMCDNLNLSCTIFVLLLWYTSTGCGLTSEATFLRCCVISDNKGDVGKENKRSGDGGGDALSASAQLSLWQISSRLHCLGLSFFPLASAPAVYPECLSSSKIHLATLAAFLRRNASSIAALNQANRSTDPR